MLLRIEKIMSTYSWTVSQVFYVFVDDHVPRYLWSLVLVNHICTSNHGSNLKEGEGRRKRKKMDLSCEKAEMDDSLIDRHGPNRGE